MSRLAARAGLFLLVSVGLPLQTQVMWPDVAAAAQRHKTSHLLRKNYLTSTGETVPHPGESQGAPTSPLDRRIEQKNNLLDRSICSNCY